MKGTSSNGQIWIEIAAMAGLSGLLAVLMNKGFARYKPVVQPPEIQPGDTPAAPWQVPKPEEKAQAEPVRRALEQASGARLGVMIIDSHGRAWRQGTVGVAIGLSGMPGLVDLRGQPDLFGYTLRVTTVGAADELAAAASLVMGQAAEGTPVVHARGFPYQLREGSFNELLRPKNMDMFR